MFSTYVDARSLKRVATKTIFFFFNIIFFATAVNVWFSFTHFPCSFAQIFFFASIFTTYKFVRPTISLFCSVNWTQQHQWFYFFSPVGSGRCHCHFWLLFYSIVLDLSPISLYHFFHHSTHLVTNYKLFKFNFFTCSYSKWHISNAIIIPLAHSLNCCYSTNVGDDVIFLFAFFFFCLDPSCYACFGLYAQVPYFCGKANQNTQITLLCVQFFFLFLFYPIDICTYDDLK